MPPLPGLAPVMAPSMVPVIRRPHSSSPGKLNKGKAPVSRVPRRQYNDEPLPIRPDTTAPKNARIVGREQEHDGALVKYQLMIGEVQINDVGVDEILDYVSALELEQFEIVRFREEAEILKVLEQDIELERQEKRARAAERARTKGAVFVDESSDSEAQALVALSRPDDPNDVQHGKHGRARPDYSKFYKKPRGKGKAIYEDLVDEEMADDSMQTNDEEIVAPQPGPAQAAGPFQELPKKRRRKRDPVTGELMPLKPLTKPKLGIEKDVRQRRKRHPLTGELMPIGWRYDPEAEGKAYEQRRMGLGSGMKESSFKRLSISEHAAKRPRLDTESTNSSSASPVPTKAEIMGQASSQHHSTPMSASRAAVVDLRSSDDESEAAVATPSSSMKPKPKQAGNSMMRGTITSTATTSADDDSSPEPVTTTSITHPTATSPSASQRTPRAQQPMTSILSPSAARARSATPSAGDSSDDDVDEGEWFIESILAHRISDPKSHPPELGKQPVMLYSVQWVGYDKPTWEPAESFGDRSFVDGYRKKVGLSALPPDDEDESANIVAPRNPTGEKRTAASTSNKSSEEESDDEEGEYEIERITAHHLSDPRTHPRELGKTPVMLYQVKWKGFNELTWEPEESFDDDVELLRVYKMRHGLR